MLPNFVVQLDNLKVAGEAKKRWRSVNSFYEERQFNCGKAREHITGF